MDIFALFVALGVALVTVTGFLLKWNFENKRSLEDLKKHVHDTKKHDDACTLYQTAMTQKVENITLKIDSIERMGNELITGQAQSETVMKFMHEISTKTNEAINKMGTSFDHLAVVLERVATQKP